MKTTTTLALVLLAAAAGCSKDKKVAKPTVTEAPKTTTAKPADSKQLEQLPADTKVSPTLALSGDIVSMCNIKSTDTNPSFDYDKDDLAPEDRTVLDQLAECLTKGALKGRAVALIGRADPRGTEEYNLGLGSRRADSVSSYLTRLGVTEPQLAVNTRGSLDATGTDEAGWAKDRRVDITLQN